jgi:hypothetical protein
VARRLHRPTTMTTSNQTSMTKRILWTITVSLASAAGAALAGRAVDKLWRTATHETPPDMPWWARWLVAKPVRLGVSGALDTNRA